MPLDQGTYEATVKSAGMTESQGGTMGIAVTFHTNNGNIDHTIWVTPKTQERVLKTLEVLGINQQRLNDLATYEDINKALAGAACSIVVEDEEYKGEWRPKVKWINEPKAAPSGDVVERMFGLLSGKKVAARPTAAAQSTFDDGDTPF